MAKKFKNSPKNVNSNAKLENSENSDGFFTAINTIFEKKATLLFWLSFSFATLFSLMLFNFKVSVGGDDSAYISRAYDFIHSFKYPSFQGPLYPIILAPIVGLFGINLPVLKLVSLFSMLLAFYFFHKAFRNKIPPFILYASLFITANTAFLLTYAGQTYSEALFFMLQALLYVYVFKFFVSPEKEAEIKKLIKPVLIIGSLLFLSVLTKNIAFSAVIAVVLFLLITKKYKSAALTIASFSSFYLVWELVKRVLWSGQEMQVGAQGAVLLQKHPYDASQGMEDFTGYLMRIWDNILLYLSKYLSQFLGIRSFDLGPNEISMTSPFLGLLVILLFAIALIFVYKQNKFALFTGIYLLVFYGITFIVLQKIWNSGRMTIVYLPFTVLFLISGLYYMSRTKNTKLLIASVISLFGGSLTLFILHKMQKAKELDLLNLRKTQNISVKDIMVQLSDYQIDLLKFFAFIIIPILIILFLVSNAKVKKMNTVAKENLNKLLANLTRLLLITSVILIFIVAFFNTAHQATKASKTLAQNIKGDIFYGFTPDWRNYLEMTRFAAKIVPANQNIACRKPNIAFIYGQRRFKGIYKVPSTDPDTLLQHLKELNVHYVIVANLRKFEARKSKQTINTIKRYLYPIQKKYPGIFTGVQAIGQDENATLFKINYEKAIQ